MHVVHFVENQSVVLSQLRKQAPSVNEEIKIKGRKGKIVDVKQIEENIVQAHVLLEKISKAQPAAVDNKKKKR
ncbi:hypothetical protein [Heyndrickxia acidicola]|uniref:Preprotein translocase subunit SecA n=1 Tax=Heyndrickxia acidicola TaxID=209389 RepID=A0ABU6MG24_9BACI|nr:hypothetical protein [Heyndrickxia acidicola]MED1203626.1 hypothetical protein [Heyndrickxia acidicola]